jgi:hypothetical protein
MGISKNFWKAGFYLLRQSGTRVKYLKTNSKSKIQLGHRGEIRAR